MSSPDGNGLPDGWKQVRFSDVVRNANDTTRDPESDGLDRVVGLTHLDSDSLAVRRWDGLDESTSFTRTFRAGQVLFGKRRAYQRKVGVPDFPGICSGDILIFESKSPDLLPDFLPFVVQSNAFFERAVGTSAGSLSPRTKWQDLAKYEFALPPLDEQRRIVEVLDAARVGHGATQEALRSAERLLASLREGAVHSGGSLIPLGQLADVFDCEHKTAPETPGPYYLIGTPQVRDGEMELSSARRVSAETYQAWTRRAVPQKGDLILTREAPVGEVGMVEVDNSVCLGQRTVLVKPRSSSDGDWLHTVLLAPSMRRSLEIRAAGTTTPHLNVKDIRELRVPQPLDRVTVLAPIRAALATHRRLARQLVRAQSMSQRLREEVLSGVQ